LTKSLTKSLAEDCPAISCGAVGALDIVFMFISVHFVFFCEEQPVWPLNPRLLIRSGRGRMWP
jgi:hypothetical protein